DLGYDSVPAFITMFRRMLGSSPRGYMRGARESGEGPKRSSGPVQASSAAA
ncbi:MAG: AraC family transcriptional regulator, partial [Mesorhizobium sp.]